MKGAEKVSDDVGREEVEKGREGAGGMKRKLVWRRDSVAPAPSFISRVTVRIITQAPTVDFEAPK